MAKPPPNSDNTPLATVKHEPQSPPSSPPPQPQPQPLVHAKPEPQDQVIVVPQQQQQQQQEGGGEGEPRFLKSIDELVNLSAAIESFRHQFNELQLLLAHIHRSIDSRCNLLAQRIKSETETETETVGTQKTETAKSGLRVLCEVMDAKNLRRHIVASISDVQNLREELTSALKHAPRPAKLVLECIGRYYLQGCRNYADKSNRTIVFKEASVIALECFLLSSESKAIKLDAAVRLRAEEGAVLWGRRLMSKGALRNAAEVEARGLLLLIGCYGIPKLFRDEDVWDLLIASNPAQISGSLRNSQVLVNRFAVIIHRMKMRGGMKIEAIDVAQVFGIQDRFPAQELLTLFLEQLEERSNKKRSNTDISPVLLKEASEMELAALRSALKYLEDNELDPKNFLPGLEFKEKIIHLEKEIVDLNEKMNNEAIQKRKADENESLEKLQIQEQKRPRFAATGSPSLPSLTSALHEQRASNHVDGMMSYDGSMSKNLLDGASSGHVNKYPASASVLYGSGVGTLPMGTTVGGSSVPHATDIASSTADCVPSAGSLARVNREKLVDGTEQILGNNVLSHESSGGLNDISLGQSLLLPYASGLFRSNLSLEGFVGLPDFSPTGAGSGSSGSDLYRFADAVL